jgi:hypothetical protein
MLLTYDRKLQYIKVDEPTEDQLRDAILTLNGKTRRGIGIYSDDGLMEVFSNIANDRVVLIYQSHKRSGKFPDPLTLIDASINRDPHQKRDIEFIATNGEGFARNLWETITRDAALNVILYFHKHHVPPDLQSWEKMLW